MTPRFQAALAGWTGSVGTALLVGLCPAAGAEEPFALVPTGNRATISTNVLVEDLFDEYQVRAWTSADGLAQNHVDAVARDRQGYLWVSTWAGLCRFNGREFVTFNPVNTPALRSETFSDLLCDRDGEVWAASKRGLYRVRDSQFDFFGTQQGLPSEEITSIAEGPDGHKWLATTGGLARFDGTNVVTYLAAGKPIHFQHLVFLPDGRAIAFVAGIPEAEPLLFHPDRGTFGPLPADFTPSDRRLRRREIVGPDARGVIWFRTESAIYHRWPDGRVEKFRDVRESMKSEWILLLCDSQGDVWITGNEPGVLERHSRGRVSRIDLSASRQITSFNSLREETGGLFWLCSRQGLVQLRARAVRNLGRRHGLLQDHVYSVADLGQQRALLGTRRWPAILDLARSEVLLFNLPGVTTSSRALLPNADGSFWVTDGNLGPTHVATDGTISRTTLAANWPYPAEQYVFYRDSQERLWIGAKTSLYLVQGDRVRCLTDGSIPGLPANDIRVIREAPDRSIWLGGNGSGITVVSPDATTVQARYTTASGLSHDGVWTLEPTDQGDVWAGTANGLNRIRQGRCQKLLTEDGLLEGVINQLLHDRHGYLWLTGLRGVYRVDPRQLSEYLDGRTEKFEVLPVTTEDGLLNAETNGEQQPAGFVDAEGRLWVPTIVGVSVINPDQFRTNNRPARPLIEKIVLDDQVIYDTGPGVAGKTRLDRALRFPGGSGRLLEIRFAAPVTETTGAATYEVRLNGYDRDWHQLGRQSGIIYPTLRPGNYSFELRVANHHRQTSLAATAFNFSIAPYWHETAWFWSGLALAALAGGYHLHRRRLNFVSHIQKLEQRAALVADRERIARDMHDDLGSRLTHISLLADIGRRQREASSDADYQELNLAAREAARAVEEIVWSANPGNDTVQSLVGYLIQHAENMLNAGGIRCRVNTAVEWPEVYLSPQTRHGVFMAFKEAIHNVLKHAGATEVRLSIQREPGAAHIGVADNGRGFALDAKRQDEQDGIGNMGERMAAAGGRVTIQSTPDTGTTVEFWFPVSAPDGSHHRPGH